MYTCYFELWRHNDLQRKQPLRCHQHLPSRAFLVFGCECHPPQSSPLLKRQRHALAGIFLVDIFGAWIFLVLENLCGDTIKTACVRVLSPLCEHVCMSVKHPHRCPIILSGWFEISLFKFTFQKTPHLKSPISYDIWVMKTCIVF